MSVYLLVARNWECPIFLKADGDLEISQEFESANSETSTSDILNWRSHAIAKIELSVIVVENSSLDGW